MNDDGLKKLWQQQPLREPAPSAAHLISAMHSKTSLLRRCLDARDLRELLACAFVIIVFGYFYFTVYREPLSRFGVWIIIGNRDNDRPQIGCLRFIRRLASFGRVKQ